MPSIEIELDRDYGQDEIKFQVNSHHLTISDDSYPAMIAALKARNEMKAKLKTLFGKTQYKVTDAEWVTFRVLCILLRRPVRRL